MRCILGARINVRVENRSWHRVLDHAFDLVRERAAHYVFDRLWVRAFDLVVANVMDRSFEEMNK